MSTSPSKFFSLLVPLCALVVTVSVMSSNTTLLSKASNNHTARQTFEFTAGTNHFSPVVLTTSTAKDLCEKVSATNVWHWYNKSGQEPVIESYHCQTGTQADNFGFTPYHGYATDLSAPGVFSISGRNAGNQGNIEVDTATMYFYSLPESVSGNMNADHICKKFSNGKLSVSSVWNYLGNTNWEEHVCDNPNTVNFQLEHGKPNFFLVQESGKVKPNNKPQSYFE